VSYRKISQVKRVLRLIPPPEIGQPKFYKTSKNLLDSPK